MSATARGPENPGFRVTPEALLGPWAVRVPTRRRAMPRLTPLVVLLATCAFARCLGGASGGRSDPRDATVTFSLEPESTRGALDVRVLLVEPTPPLRDDGSEPPLARFGAPFVSVLPGARRGSFELGGVPEGPVVVLVTSLAARRAAARARPAPDSVVARVAWRALDARAGARYALGTLRPLDARTTLEHALVERHGRRDVDVGRLALARPAHLGAELVPRVPRGEPAPVVRVDVPLGGTARVDGVDAARVDFPLRMGPEHLAPGWLLGAERRADDSGQVLVTCEVARAVIVPLRVLGVPQDADVVHVWARRDAPDGARWTHTVDAARGPADAADVARAELALAPGTWRVLARAVDREGRPVGATALTAVALDHALRPAACEVVLSPAASMVVRGSPRRAGAQVAARPEGWSVDLAAGALGRDGTLRLDGLVPNEVHVVVVGETRRRLKAPAAGRVREVEVP